MQAAASAQTAASTRKKVKKTSERAVKLRQKRQRKALQQRMRKCQEKCDEALAFLYPTNTKNAQPNYTKAKATLESGLQFYSDNAQLYFLLGQCASGLNNLQQAIDHYSTALDKDAHYVCALQARARCYYWLKNYVHAIQDCTSTIQLQPNNDYAYNMRGLCLFQQRVPGLRLRRELFENCVSNFKRATQLNQANYHAFVNLAAVYEQQGQYNNAVQNYTQALRAKQDYAYAKFRRASAYLQIAQQIQRKYEFAPSKVKQNVKQVQEDILQVNKKTIMMQSNNNLSNKNEKVIQAISPFGLKISCKLNCLEQESEQNILHEVQRQKDIQNAHVQFQSYLHKAEDDFVSLLPVQSDANRLTTDPMFTIKLFTCALKLNKLNVAQKYLRWSEQIASARSNLVNEGLATPLNDQILITQVISICKLKLREACDVDAKVQQLRHNESNNI